MAQNTSYIKVRRKQREVIAWVFIEQFSSTGSGGTGKGYEALADNDADLQMTRSRSGGNTTYNIQGITTIGTYQAPTDGDRIRFDLVQDAGCPGLYELHFHNDEFEDEGRTVVSIEDNSSSRRFCPTHLVIDIEKE